MTLRMLCVDPGLRGCGAAEFMGDRLMRAAYVKNPFRSGRGYGVCATLGQNVYEWAAIGNHPVDSIVIEHPVFYGSVHQKGDPNDTLDCGIVGSAVASHWLIHRVETVFPSDWKGQVPKQKMLVRIWEKLTDEERAVVQKTNKSDTEDILDAIGIGLWKLNRLSTRKFAND